MSEKLFPFPYLVNTSGMLNEGSVFRIPKFCKLNCGSKICRTFYKQKSNQVGFYTCPNGFAVEVRKMNDNHICFTCLNIARLSSRKDMAKKILKEDFMPRITQSDYLQILENVDNLVNLKNDFYDKNLQFDNKENDIKEKTDLINDTLHELRKLNAQLKSDVEIFIKEMDNFQWNRIEEIKNKSQNIFSVTQLISIRLNTYDFGINPNRFLSMSRRPIQIYKKFNKAVYCLDSSAKLKKIRIKLSGESYSSIMALDIIELLPYLFLDNAIKYSYPSADIYVTFNEVKNNLIVEISGISLTPDSSEIGLLVDRGKRGHNAQFICSQGEGIGLYLANMICEIHDINMDIKISRGRNDFKYDNGYKYSQFKVILTFYDIIKMSSDETYIDDIYI